MRLGHRNHHRSPDAGDGGAGGGGQGGGAPPGTGSNGSNRSSSARSERPWSPNVERQFLEFMESRGGADSASRYMWAELYNVRRRNKELREELDGYRTRNPQGSVVLSAEQVTAWNAYQQLGKPEELKTKLAESARLAGELATTKRREVRKEAATVLGFHAAVLGDRLDIAQLDVELREETDAQGQKKKVPYARKQNDQNATWEALGTIAQRDWAEYLPALRAQAAGTNGTAGQSAPAGQANGTPNGAAGGDAAWLAYPANGASGGQPPQNPVDRFIAQRDAQQQHVANPLKPPGAASQPARPAA